MKGSTGEAETERPLILNLFAYRQVTGAKPMARPLMTVFFETGVVYIIFLILGADVSPVCCACTRQGNMKNNRQDKPMIG